MEIEKMEKREISKSKNSEFPDSQFPESKILRLHATCVAIKSHGVLLVGEPKSGKSDLALRLIDRGATLVSDDQVELTRDGDTITAHTPGNIAGLIEVRGVGIFKKKYQSKQQVHLVVQLNSKEAIERLPYPESFECMGINIPQLRLCPFEASSVIKIEMAIAALEDHSMMVGMLKDDE